MVIQTADRASGVYLAGDATNTSGPTAAEVKALFEDYQPYYRQFHANCKKADDYYNSKNVIPVPEDMAAVPVHTGSAHAIINIATDHVDVNNMDIAVLSTERTRARAERREKFYKGFWLSIKKPVLRIAARHAFAYGIGWIKQMYVQEQWPDAPHLGDFNNEEEWKDAMRDWQDARNIAFPFDVLNVNPQNILWDDSRTGPRWVIEFYQATGGALRRWYPEFTKSLPSKDQVSWMEYWDEKFYGVMIDGEWAVGPYEHNYGFLPYHPIIPANSMDIDNGAPHERYQGILAPAYSLLDAEGRIMTAYEAILTTYAWRTVDFSGTNRVAIDETKEAYELVGSKNTINPGVEVKASPAVTPPPELLQFLSVVQSQSEQVTFPNVVRGQRPKGASSGFMVSVLAGMGRLIFQGVADGVARAVEGVNSGTSKLIVNKLKARVTVHARSDVHNFDQAIGPDDIRGAHENHVVLKAEAPEEAERQSQLAMTLWNNGEGLISKYEAMRRARVANPLEDLLQQDTEAFLAAIRPAQHEQLIEQMAGQLSGQLASAAGGFNSGQFQPGLGQPARPGEVAIQRRRVQTRQNQELVFPGSVGDQSLLGRRGSVAGGPGLRQPSGGRTR